MTFDKFKEVFQLGPNLSRKMFLSSMILVTNGFVWFFMSSMVLRNAIPSPRDYEYLLVLAANSSSTAIAALIGAFFPKGSGRIRAIKIWMIAGTIVSIVPLIVDMTEFVYAIVIAILWGVTLGFGMPLSMEYLTDNTTVENRGRVGATVFFTTFLGIVVSTLVFDPGLSILAYQSQLIILGAWRIAGLAIFMLLIPSEVLMGKKIPTYVNIVQERSFILYFSAWLMFSLINYLSAPILNNHFQEDFVNTSTLLETLLTITFALPAGIFCDTVGRKKPIMLGFIMLGLGYAVLGIFPGSLAGWYFYTVVDGIAWGILGVMFFMIIWGDIAYGQSSRKYFALGGLPILFTNFLQRLISPDLAASIPVAAVFSLASFFLFLAVIPLIYAPETLPEKKIQERQIKKYIEEAKKIAEEETKT
jgi:MFS family permease